MVDIPLLHPLTDEAGLRLVPLQTAHASEIFQLVDRDRTRLGRRLPWVETCRERSDTLGFIAGSVIRRNRAEGGDGSGDWAIEATIEGTPTLVGVIGLHTTRLHHRRTAIGYWIGSAYEGRGFVTRAARLVADHCVEQGLHRVEIHVATDNQRSRAVAERLGFEFEGVTRAAEWIHGRPCDHAIYARIESTEPR